MEKQKLYISVDVDKEGMLGKIATAIKLEDELRDGCVWMRGKKLRQVYRFSIRTVDK